jgi:hypothetical protein
VALEGALIKHMQVLSQPPTLDPANGRDLIILRFPEQECGNTVGFPFHISDQPGAFLRTWVRTYESGHVGDEFGIFPTTSLPRTFSSNFHRAKKSGHTIIRARKLRFLT